jgi:signal transduction histidine kinase
MKKININLKLASIVVAPLFILIIVQSILEYRSGRKAVVDLMARQSEALILSVARAGEKGIIAYEFQQREILNHLYSFARLLDRYDRTGRAIDENLLKDYSGGEIKIAILLNDKGEIQKNLRNPGQNLETAAYAHRLSPVIKGETGETSLGIISAADGARYFAAAVGRPSGGAVVLAIDARELLSLRRNFGAGSVIDYLSDSPGILYAGILKEGTILAASRDFPVSHVDNWYSEPPPGEDNIKARIIKGPGSTEGDIFEAAGSFGVAGEILGEIVVGLSTAQLELVTTKLKRDIVWRSILFLMIAVTALGGLLLRQNYRLLTQKYGEIREEVRWLEADRAASERLTAMGELAKGVAHEIRNPLNAIRVIIQRLKREFTPGNDIDEYRELTDIIQKETDRVNQSVNAFLEMSRPPVLNKSRGDLVACLTEIVSLFKPRADARGCEIKTDFSQIPQINFDSNLCRQGVLNLLENSLSAVGDNGLIKISAGCKDGMARVDIEDNGPGIPEELKSRVFDLYYTTKDTGTGLGLPTVLRIVKEHGGRIDLSDSSLGGARFRLELPVE